MKSKADSFNVLINIPLYTSSDGEKGGLEELAKSLNIKHGSEITQEDLAKKCSALINAAPELLEACKLALTALKNRFPADHGMEDVGMAWGACETAIQKAE